MRVHTEPQWFTPRQAITVGVLAVSILGILLWRSFRRAHLHPNRQTAAHPGLAT